MGLAGHNRRRREMYERRQRGNYEVYLKVVEADDALVKEAEALGVDPEFMDMTDAELRAYIDETVSTPDETPVDVSGLDHLNLARFATAIREFVHEGDETAELEEELAEIGIECDGLEIDDEPEPQPKTGKVTKAAKPPVAPSEEVPNE